MTSSLEFVCNRNAFVINALLTEIMCSLLQFVFKYSVFSFNIILKNERKYLFILYELKMCTCKKNERKETKTIDDMALNWNGK